MTLVHIVLLRIRPSVQAASIQNLTDRLHQMKQEIPYIKRCHAGNNITERGKGYNYAITVELTSKAELNPYRDHPFHQEILKTIKEVVEEDGVLAMDYETDI
ncbi:hypothetical protein CONCODRAFT_14641 [Conidiobolus coronatus NRRL 28638]|uniref:Stress-response A/B barrel domain-containing protein n=1 Tax=Conidiobolus coronatus (strain ATCC 28846 / CBS 209.66 / NRRL 28638) TaxID=796925 RepID=A0A137PI45_CONC2|nr:hypothetical protein CONCODRAFT_14641 [Conidiobolus coronatus NRRL 28638]|eukprot:KXN74677.1 hypothetical protein CONCODRAFT_14641 [Conidiobolus coronatus NRRL 28638]